MTNKEAIKVLSSWAECKYKPTHDAACLAIAALQAQAEAEKNDPLTLDELREMAWAGLSVWCVDTDGINQGLLCMRDGWDAPRKSPHV